jgi:DNA-binding response OmpR family regulator
MAMIKLLVVDDENDVREFVANFFRKRQIEVITATAGEEALEMIKQQKPRLVLLDIKMEGLNGVETLRLIKQNDPSIDVIMVTGKKPEEEDACKQCRELGALAYIHKPLELEELERIVLGVLR